MRHNKWVMKKPEQPDLLRRARAFDLDALAEIYDQYSPSIYAYALRLLGDEMQAEDCVAEVFSRLLKALKAGQGPQDHLQAYLYRVAHNWITDTYRRQPPPPVELSENLMEDEQHQPEPGAQRRLQAERIRAALRLLPPEQRQVIALRFFQECSSEEVAVALNKTEGAVKAMQHRALASLRKLLGLEAFDETER